VSRKNNRREEMGCGEKTEHICMMHSDPVIAIARRILIL